MTVLRLPKDFRAIRSLPFCYICGIAFDECDETNADHVPPKTAFNPRDREPPVKLTTHKSCNSKFSVQDKQVGQLIALRRGERPKSARDRALKFVPYPHLDMVALENLNVDGAVWRWVAGFHAALYQMPLAAPRGSIQTPFLRAHKRDGQVKFSPLLQQHLEFVAAIKRNRVFANLDRIISNNGKLNYECVWAQFDDRTTWFCIFALDIYDWKDFGSSAPGIPQHGCVGFYILPDGSVPDTAARDRASVIRVPNYDIFDPFAR